MTNLMTRIGWDARIALREGKGKLEEAARDRINTEIEEMIGYMLFVDEAQLKEPVKASRRSRKRSPRAGRAIPLAGHCGTLICRSGCSATRCPT